LNNKQGQTQSQSNTSVNKNQSAGGSSAVSDIGSNNQTTVEAPQIPVNSAYAPTVFSTVNCFKGFSAGGQAAVGGVSFGGGKIDSNCAAERIAQDYYAMGNRLAACKVIITTKYSKAAGVTLEDCMNVPVPIQRVIAPQPAPVAVQPVKVEIINNIPPAPAPIIIHESIDVIGPKLPPLHAKKRMVHRPCPVTPLQNECPVVREK
jgi:hypothetical protein